MAKAPPDAADLLLRLEQRMDRVELLVAMAGARLDTLEGALPAAAPAPAQPAVVEVKPAAVVALPEVPVAAQVPVAAIEPEAPEIEAAAPAPLPEAEPVFAWRAKYARPAAPTGAAKPSPVARDWEQLVGERGLAVMGGLAVLIGAIFFLSLAFSRGWIGPSARVVIGTVAGAAFIAGGAWFFGRREALFGYVLSAVGLAVTNLSMMAATRLYDLIPIELGLLGALASAVAAAAIAIRHDTQVVAAFGIAAALAAPPILGASPNATTIAFLGASLIGATTIALYRTWSWLPPLAFVFSAPQLAVWIIEDAPVGPGLAALAGFWVLHAVAAGGEEFRVRRSKLQPWSATVLLANAAFVVGYGFALLSGDNERWRGAFLLAVAAAHALIGGYFLKREGDRHPFGLLAAGAGLTALTMAVPVQLGGPVVAIAWAAEATALTWVAARRSHRYSAIASGVLGALAIGHLLAFEYPLGEIDQGFDHTPPFVGAEGGTLAFILGAIAVAGYLMRRPSVRAPLTALGAGLILVAMPFELSGIALLAGWAGLAAVTLGTRRWPALAPIETALPENRWSSLIPLTRVSIEVAAAAAMACAAGHLMSVDVPLADLVDRSRPGTPFTDRETFAVTILIAAAVLGAWATPFRQVRRAGVVIAIGAAGYLMPFELETAAMVVAWALLSLAPLVMAERDRAAATLYHGVGGTLLGIGVLFIWAKVAPLDRLFVDERSTIDHPLFWSGATATCAAVAGALAVAVRRNRTAFWAKAATVIAGALVIYLLSVGVVDAFQRRVGGDQDLGSLQKQAQVALSILWAVIGVGIFAAGIARFGRSIRLFGLAVLGLATAKVFIYDLASLNASYRVLSFIGLGLLLLASSYAYQRLVRTRDRDDAGREDGGPDTPPVANSPAAPA